MSRLPPEILHKIFYQLAFRDRLECTLVCRSWWRILDKYSLFYNVEIIYEINEFSMFMEMFMRSPHRAAQVQKMRLLSCLNISFNKRTLLNTFPNVRVLKVEWSDGWIRQCEESSYFSEPIKMTRSTSKIKVLHDSVHCELALQMLKSNLCGRLEVLALNFSDVSHVSIQVILKKLKNLPVLKRLTLQNVAIKINNLESIHKNIPTVETFRLIDVSIRPGKAPSHVTSASSISTLEIDICRAVDRELHSRFYQYICKKYPNITNIEYNDQQLKSYTPDDLSYVYLNGIYDFYKYIIIPNKKKLKIKDIPNDFNLFELADHLNCQFEELHFIQYKGEALFGYLAQSHQSKHIQKLILNDTVIAPLGSLKSMVALTTLYLYFYNKQLIINLNNYLNECLSTLKHLSINCPRIIVDPSYTHLSDIETLEIQCNDLSSSLGDVITRSLPGLKKLKLTGTIIKSLNITLSNLSFQEARFRIIATGSYSFTFITPNENQQYFINKNNAVLFDGDDDEHMLCFPALKVSSVTEKRLDLSSGIKILSI